MNKNSTKINLGLAGAGYWGKNLIRVFWQLGVLKTVCDLDEKRLNEVKKNYPGLKTTKDFREILENKEIKGVVISTSAVTHYELAKKALAAGKDVFVEKPLALNLEEGEELVRLAEEKNLILMVGHLLNYHPAIVELKKIVKGGQLGKILHIYSHRLNFGRLRKEENVLWSFAPHDISLILNFLGEMPKEIRTIGHSYLQKNIPDITLSHYKFPNHSTAHIMVNWLNPIKEQRLVIIGTKKMAVFDDQARDKLVIFSHTIIWQNGAPVANKKEGKIISFPDKEPLLEEAKHFLDCLSDRKTPKTDGKEALRVLKVLFLSQKSLEENGNLKKL